MNEKITIEVPKQIEDVTNAATGLAACSVMLVLSIIKGILATVRFVCGGAFRIAAGAVTGGVAAARSRAS